MKVVVLDSLNADKILEHFIAYGYDDFISFGKTDRGYYQLNGINVTEINSTGYEKARERLLKIRGSLGQRFMIVYSLGVLEIDLDRLLQIHLQGQGIATVAMWESKLCVAAFEPEIFDYLGKNESLERDALLEIAQSGEMRIYN